MRQYWKFFSVAVAALVFIVLVVLFFKGAFQTERDYEVTIKSQGQDIKLENAPTLDAPANNADAAAATTTATTTVSLINRSGDETLIAKITEALAQNNITIGSSSTDGASVEEKTVIVYPPDASKLALRLSKLFGNALLSAYSDGSEGQEVIIYIGADQKTRE